MFIVIVLLVAVLWQTCFAETFCSAEDGCDCGIAGTWRNQLGSNVTFTCKDGQLDGKYNSAVGHAEDYYLLSGRYTLSGPKNDVVELGWVVSWNNKKFGNSHSATAWSGIYYPEDGIIRTQWILTRFKERKDNWETSFVNHDEFKRIR
ncbi:streptavidin-V2-like [Ruditapes philippinarum]|uniref:streptavidin-V2-like n=1 Tax=Ruditapes philippinarum TaxID=129788 RepID=UPI00295AAFD3|nr:streptavidin-V2-like [Ruditapes philippinarum]